MCDKEVWRAFLHWHTYPIRFLFVSYECSECLSYGIKRQPAQDMKGIFTQQNLTNVVATSSRPAHGDILSNHACTCHFISFKVQWFWHGIWTDATLTLAFQIWLQYFLMCTQCSEILCVCCCTVCCVVNISPGTWACYRSPWDKRGWQGEISQDQVICDISCHHEHAAE